MNELEGGVKNCSTAAITRVFAYYRGLGVKRIPDDAQLYREIKKAAQARGYTGRRGTGFTKIDDIINDMLVSYGLSGKAKSIYIWDFNTVKKEIDSNKPLILNIAFGKYADHTVTVVGYREFKEKRKRRVRILRIYDGWSRGVSELGFNKLGIASFTVLDLF